MRRNLTKVRGNLIIFPYSQLITFAINKKGVHKEGSVGHKYETEKKLQR